MERERDRQKERASSSSISRMAGAPYPSIFTVSLIFVITQVAAPPTPGSETIKFFKTV